jgi:alkylation response protein AidB-like acyl-CoA dehydrogenase
MVRSDDGGKRIGTAMIPRDTPGMRIDYVWDAIGMRASGSDDIVFEDCFVPDDAVVIGQKWGTFGPAVAGGMIGGIALMAVFLGIAEAAYGHAIEAAMTRKRRRETPMREIPAVQLAVAEMDIQLSTARASVDRVSRLFDEHLAIDTPLPEQQQLMKEVQAAKHYVNRAAIEITDHALALSGGAGYLNKSPLSRLYRDVRAGPFMSPLTAGDGIEYVGKVALGFDPDE